MERGEVDGRCGWSWSSIKAEKAQWLAEHKLNLIVQLALEKAPDLPNVPLITDLATDDRQRQILKLIFSRQTMGRPFAGPPGIPAERAEALRKAFDLTMKDPEFLAEAAEARPRDQSGVGPRSREADHRALPDPEGHRRRGARSDRALALERARFST